MNLEAFILNYNSLRDYDLLFSYIGKANDDLTYNFIELSTYTYTVNKDISKLKKKASFLLAECFQNIIRHSPDIDEENASIKFTDQGLINVMSKNNIGYYVTGNFIKNDEIDDIIAKIEQINSLDKVALKQFSLELLNKNEFNEKGGASIGLVDMARKSNYKLRYKFDKIDDKYSAFFLLVTLLSPEFDDSKADIVENPLDSVYFDPNYTTTSLITYKGEINATIGQLLKELMQSEYILSEGAKNNKLNIGDALIDVMAYSTTKGDINNFNVSGMFTLKVYDDYALIRMGKIIRPKSKETIDLFVSKIENYNTKELEKVRDEAMAMSDDIPYKKIHLGLSKMYLKYKDNFSYKIMESEGGNFIYAIELTI